MQDEDQDEDELVVGGPAQPLKMDAHDSDPVKLTKFAAAQEEQATNPKRGDEFGLTTMSLSHTASIQYRKRERLYTADVEFKQLVCWETASGRVRTGNLTFPMRPPQQLPA